MARPPKRPVYISRVGDPDIQPGLPTPDLLGPGSMGNPGLYPIKVHIPVRRSEKEAWRAEADRRGITLAELVRQQVNREIERIARAEPGGTNLNCSFCGKGQQEVVRLIVAPAGSAFICDECVNVCSGLVAGAS